MFRLLDHVRTGLEYRGRGQLEPENRCMTLFLLGTLRRVSSLAVLTPLEIGLRDVLHRCRHLWEEPECILAKEDTMYADEPHDSKIEFNEMWQGSEIILRATQQVELQCLDMLKPQDMELACIVTRRTVLLEWCIKALCDLDFRIAEDIEGVLVWIQRTALKVWLISRKRIEIQDALDACFNVLFQDKIPVVPALDFDLDHVVVPKDRALIKFVCGLLLFRTLSIPDLASLEQTTYRLALHTCISSWYTRLRSHRETNRDLYDELLLAMGLLDVLGISEFDEARKERFPDLFRNSKRDDIIIQNARTITESVWSCILWLFLDARLGIFAERRTSSRRRKLDIDYRSDDILSTTPYFWDNFGKVYLAKSQISSTLDTGYGVFAATNFEPGDVITEYVGTYYKGSYVKDSPYLRVYEKNRDRYIDGNNKPEQCTSRQIAQMVQDPITPKYYNSGNVRLLANEVDPKFRGDIGVVSSRNKPLDPSTSERLMEVAMKKIRKGEEIYTSYGYSADGYKKFGMVPKDASSRTLPAPKPLNILKN